MRVAHVITRMIIGGAQENTLYNCRDLQEDFGDDVLLITGPGDRAPKAICSTVKEGRALRLNMSPVCDELSIRGATGRASVTSKDCSASSSPMLSILTAQRAGS